MSQIDSFTTREHQKCVVPKILLFQKKSEFPEVRRIGIFFMACIFRLIICLSLYKKFGLVAICFVWKKIEIFRRIFYLEFCGHLEIELCLQWLTIYYRLFSMKQSSNILKYNSNSKSHKSYCEKLKNIKWKMNCQNVPNYPLLRYMK